MKGHDFKRWRKSLGWSQKEAAEALGLKRRVVQYYEKGERDDQPVKIPRTVRLACYALTLGIEDYDGPPKLKDLVERNDETKQTKKLAKKKVLSTEKKKKHADDKPKKKLKKKLKAKPDKSDFVHAQLVEDRGLRVRQARLETIEDLDIDDTDSGN
ncbi:MAG TPA: hypothetical protein DCL54_18355 [Alphaproteobacteria bacterium]|nr:hypothetical protein [Alphaproteobacteria bacterium]HAJ48544.1 hypothetical protein [Alphaproteobacteria bacterium]